MKNKKQIILIIILVLLVIDGIYFYANKAGDNTASVASTALSNEELDFSEIVERLNALNLINDDKLDEARDLASSLQGQDLDQVE